MKHLLEIMSANVIKSKRIEILDILSIIQKTGGYLLR